MPHEAGSLADPYCKLCIQPNRKQQVQTKVHKQTLSPEFDEEFLFEVLPEDLPNRTLEILVYDHDQYSKDECLGQCEIPLESVDLSEKAVLWRGVMQYDKKKEEVRILLTVEIILSGNYCKNCCTVVLSCSLPPFPQTL